jgi:hypothetical protein
LCIGTNIYPRDGAEGALITGYIFTFISGPGEGGDELFGGTIRPVNLLMEAATQGMQLAGGEELLSHVYFIQKEES